MRLNVLLALLFALAATGCGGGSTTPTLQSEAVTTQTADGQTEATDGSTERSVDRNPPPALASGDDATFATALGSIAAYGTGRFEGRMEIVDESPGAEPSVVEVSGVYDRSIAASRFDVDMAALLSGAEGAELPGMDAYFEEPLTAVSIDDEMWIQWELLSVLTGTPGAWITTDVSAAAASTELGAVSGFGDPTSALDELAEADVVVEETGTEVLRDVTVRHWSTTLDLDELGSQIGLAGRADLETAFGSLDPEGVTVELWVGDADGLLHRYRLANASADADQAGPGSSITIDFFDHGVPITIERPPADLEVDGSILWG